MLLLNLLYTAIGLVALYYGSEFLVTGSSRIALAFKISPLIIGLTIVATGTSTPELFVSTLGALQGESAIALGNVVGSNIANIGFILGLCGVVAVISVHEVMVKREIPMLIVVSLYALLISLDGTIDRIDGLTLLIGFGLFTYLFYVLATSPQAAETVSVDAPKVDDLKAIKIPLESGRMALGIVLLMIGAQFLIIGASEIARTFNISESVIGLTVVAVGTSLPELATSLVASMKGEDDIAIGNVVGSNIVNILLVLGVSTTITPIHMNQTEIFLLDYLVMLVFAVMLLPFARHRKLSKLESAIFLGAYFAYVIYSFVF